MLSIIFYGAGQNARDNFARWEKNGLVPVCFADADVEKHYTKFEISPLREGIEILPLFEAITRYPDYELCLTQNAESVDNVRAYLLNIGIPSERISACDNKRFSDLKISVEKSLQEFLILERKKCNIDGSCPMPSFHPHISYGNSVHYCAPTDQPNSIGVLGNEKTLQDIWYSEDIETIRTKIKNDDYSKCALLTCASEGRYLAFYDYFRYIKAMTGKNPVVIKFLHDYECNYHCIMCRSHIRVREKKELEKLNEKIESIFLPMCKDADAVYFAGDGDPIASRHYRALISAIASKYSQIKFILHTNGSLITEKNLSDLGIVDRVDSVLISLNAAYKSTYEKISPGASWERLQKNIEYINDCQKSGKIRSLHFSMIVQKANFSEMPDFVEFARKHNAKCRFTLVHPISISDLSYDNNCVFDSNHPEFSAYLKILHNPVFDWDGCFLDPYSKWLRECNR